MAGEAFFSISTTPTKALSTQFLNHPRSFAARLKLSFFSTAHPASCFLSLASKSNSSSKLAPSAGFGKKAKQKVQDDPWESLFQQLEKDLENDTEDSNEEEITEEDVANFERELDMVVEDLANASTSNGVANELDDMLRAHNKDIIKDNDDDDSSTDDEDGINAEKGNENDDDDGVEDDDEGIDYDDEDFSDDDSEEPRKVTLQRWQLRKLAAAAALGRRKVHIKSLAADLQLDRDDVLYFLKTPPPELLMVASEMEEEDRGEDEDDEPVSNEEEIMADDEETDMNQSISTNDGLDLEEVEEVQKQTYGPRDWMKGKRLKKVNKATLERVYKRSKWPSNAMVENLVKATNLPRVRILEWFEEERAKSGVIDPPRQSTASRKSWKRPVTHSFERLQ
eukprot:c14546_g1_i1 orf=101-1285(+)